MRNYVALLRAVNLPGHNKVATSELRDLFMQLSFVDPRPLLQSGNVVFRSAGQTGPNLERLLEAEAEMRLGLRTDFFVRTVEEWKAIIAGNPFRDEAKRHPNHLLVMFLKDA